jgi:hypothetical protein
MNARIESEIAHYLKTGECDHDHHAWLGDLFERGHRAREDLRGALVHEVRRAAGRGRPAPRIADHNLIAFTRHKVESATDWWGSFDALMIHTLNCP